MKRLQDVSIKKPGERPLFDHGRRIRLEKRVDRLPHDAGSEGSKSIHTLDVRVKGNDERSKGNGVLGKIYNLLINRHGRQVDYSSAFVKSESRLIKNYPESSSENVLIKYEWLKSRGFPVLPTMRVNRENQALHMTYLQGEILDKHLPKEQRIQLVKKIKNLDEIKAEIRAIAEQAYDNGNGVYLFLDAYSVEVLPDGMAKVWLIDIGARSHYLPNTIQEVKTQNHLDLKTAKEHANRFIDKYLAV